jgi:signal transduction histidine kinase
MARETQSQFGLAAIFDNVRDGLVLVRFPQREIVLFNRAASETTGIPINKAMGTRLDRIFSDPKVHETARSCSAQPVGVWPGHAQDVLQTHIPGRHGHQTDVELHFCRVDDVGLGGPLVLLVMRPSTEAELEAAVKKGEIAQRRVDSLERDVREHALFFSEAAHEFNTPLTIVALQAELLRGALGPVVPVQERALSIINANVHRLVLLSQDLVDLARADAGRLILKAAPIDFFKLVKEEIANFQSLAAQQKLTIDFAATGKDPTVLGEPARLRQVLANFLGNAIKFTPEGGRVMVEASGDAEGASVRIQDTGPGMDAEDQARLFRPFVRIDRPDSPKKPGTGLGLYLSKRIVEAHGGQVGCSSAGRGQGMTFWFKVPLAKAAAEETSDARRGRRQRPAPASRAERRAGVPRARPDGQAAEGRIQETASE